ncbi:MAG: hypothetical protein JRJ12_09760 [Deltaproteobacteria bacterium]|nr:hypothetical protein [Deltaproteobacteria bacterium]MBW2071327.1 hypothetical protein [Deltaproteobacteria bacterium]
MKWILLIIGMAWIALGTWLNIYPQQSRLQVKSLLQRVPGKWLAVATAVIGLLLLFAAPASHQGAGFVRILGILALAKAIIFAVLSVERRSRLLDWWFASTNEQVLRISGLLLVIIAVVLISWL